MTDWAGGENPSSSFLLSLSLSVTPLDNLFLSLWVDQKDRVTRSFHYVLCTRRSVVLGLQGPLGGQLYSVCRVYYNALCRLGGFVVMFCCTSVWLDLRNR